MVRPSPAVAAQRVAIMSNGSVVGGEQSQTRELSIVWDKMAAPLQQRVMEIEGRHHDTTVATLRYYYALGQTCLEIAANPAVYGPDGASLVERYFEISHLPIRKCRQFATTISPDQFQELLKLQHVETKYRLHWGHVCVLLSVPTADARQRLAIAAIRGHWDVKRLREEVHKLQGAKDARNTGRKHKLPPTIEGQARQIDTVTRVWIDKKTKVWDGEVSVFNNLDALAPEEVTAELVETVARAQAAVIEMDALVDQTRLRLTTLLKSLESKRRKAEKARQA